MLKHPRQHDPDHLAYLRTLPCCVCGDDTATEAAHIRFADPMIGKNNPGIGAKPDDKYALPVCGSDHRKQHEGSETQWWAKLGIDPVKVALALYAVSGDYADGCRIVAACRELRAA